MNSGRIAERTLGMGMWMWFRMMCSSNGCGDLKLEVEPLFILRLLSCQLEEVISPRCATDGEERPVSVIGQRLEV